MCVGRSLLHRILRRAWYVVRRGRSVMRVRPRNLAHDDVRQTGVLCLRRSLRGCQGCIAPPGPRARGRWWHLGLFPQPAPCRKRRPSRGGRVAGFARRLAARCAPHVRRAAVVVRGIGHRLEAHGAARALPRVRRACVVREEGAADGVAPPLLRECGGARAGRAAGAWGA